jgi:multiple antibiotic resistance protein
VGSASFVRRAQRSNAQEIASETAEGIPNDDIVITPLAVPMLAGPVAISTVVLLDVQAIFWISRVQLLACVVLVGLASYAVLALGASGAKRISSLAEKIITRLRGLLLAALAVLVLF